MNYLPNLNSDVKIAFGATNVFCQFEAVKADAGLAVLPCWLADDDPKLVRVLHDEINIRGTFWLAMNSDMRDLPAVRLVSQFIADEVGKIGRASCRERVCQYV